MDLFPIGTRLVVEVVESKDGNFDFRDDEKDVTFKLIQVEFLLNEEEE
jgi:hypothetical protein